MARHGLQRFRLDDIHCTGDEIGRGAYAVVKKLDYQGRICAGKELLQLLYELADPSQKDKMLRTFAEECELLHHIDHPNIVKFLGVYYRTSSGLPSLVMEYLPNGNLSGYLKRHGVLPDETSLGILRDVATGLRYLHEHKPPIIHRDLTANNVLLTDNMSAKISDLGTAKILDMSPARAAQMTQTQAPGTTVYMPLEALVDRPKYTHKIDIFSLGVLIMHVLSGEWPVRSETGFTKDPRNPSNLVVVTEFDRRRSTVEKIKDDHPLLGLIQHCLNNLPEERPDSEEVVCQPNRLCSPPEVRSPPEQRSPPEVRSPPEQRSPSRSMQYEVEYYDFVLIGKTGQGKSCVGNKLLQLERIRGKFNHDMVLRRFTSGLVGLLRDSTQPYTRGQMRFTTTDDISTDNPDMRAYSVTAMCELLANDETKVRVLDVPGFSDLGFLPRAQISVFDGNVQIVRWIVRVQASTDLRVRRMVYFLPTRGVLERADRTLQEELQVLHHFFGDTIFNCMVVVATNQCGKSAQAIGYDEESFRETGMAFHQALKQAANNDSIGCPPIVYIGVKDSGTEIIKKLQYAKVLKDEPLQLKFYDDVCSRCSVKIRKLGGENIGIVNSAGTLIDYKESKCHPCFVPKYTTWQKFWGGVGHTVTAGTALAAGAIGDFKVWPSFTNSDEICPVCKNSPGSPGCCTAGAPVTYTWDSKQTTTEVLHTSEL